MLGSKGKKSLPFFPVLGDTNWNLVTYFLPFSPVPQSAIQGSNFWPRSPKVQLYHQVYLLSSSSTPSLPTLTSPLTSTPASSSSSTALRGR